ncbi:unnamed protein product, partial [Hapterophycus canaliculatus]
LSATQDRYPHPLGMASRRSFVDSAGREARDGAGVFGGVGGTGGMVGGGLMQMPPPMAAVKAPLHAARPIDQAGTGPKIMFADDQTGASLGASKKSDAVSGAGGSDGGGGGGGGGGGAGTTMGIGDWRQKLLNGVEEALVEGRRGKSKVGVEMHPDNEGLFVSWRFLAALVGGVVAIVAAVACLAYKYGATAMANVTTITRRAGSATKLGSNGSPEAVRGDAADAADAAGGRKRPSESAMLGGVPSGRLSPPAVADSPSLQHGASTSAMYVGSRLSGLPPGGVHQGILGPSGSPTEALPQRSASMHDVHIQRVHSLPALGQCHSPPTNADGRWRNPRQGFNELFVSADGALANGVGNAGKLARAMSASVNGGVPLQNGGKSPGTDVSGAGRLATATGSPSGAQAQAAVALEGSWPSSAASGSPSSATSGTSASEASGREKSGPVSRRGRSDSSAAPRSAAAATMATASAAAGASAESGGTPSRRRPSRRESWSSSWSSSEEEEEEGEEDPDGSENRRRRGLRRRQQQQQQQPSQQELRRGRSRRSQDLSSGEEGREGGSGRTRRTLSEAAQAVGRGGGRDRRASSRRASRSPRPSVGSTALDELFDAGTGGGAAGGGGGGSGSGGCAFDSAVVATGGDDEDALLVTNRRLRTEFVEGQKLGKGGFGTVFKCRNRLDGHDYAVKKIRLSSDPQWQPQLAKVLREVKIMSLLDHPNIVRYYQA